MAHSIEALDFLDGVKLKGPSRWKRFGRRLCPRLVAAEYDTETTPLFQARSREEPSVFQKIKKYVCCKIQSSSNSLQQVQRNIIIGQPESHQYAANTISTAKYNFFTFIPRFLFEQFRKYANLFFLFIACLQQIPGVSPTGRFTTLIPLIVILLLSALKELIEDIKRHQADSRVNNSKVMVLRDKQWATVKWKNIRVGDFIKLNDDALIPADTLLLSSSEPQGIAYIETANLDGETNLKIRKGVTKTSHILTSADLAELTGKIVCEGPNRYLYDYVGTIYIGSNEESQLAVPLGPSELLLRGSKLKNTGWVFGVVIYTGEESKLRLNSVKTPLKRSHIEKLTNIQILLLFGTLLLLSMITALLNVRWIGINGKGIWYENVHVTNYLFQFLTYVILYNNLIPISLQVTLEFVKFVQAFYINWDTDMYHAETDTPAVARTSNLNEELGQIKYIFSDKTGTLTRNVMEFKGCSINGVVYRDMDGIEGESLFELSRRANTKHADARAIDKFMKFLAVCHTVVPEKTDNGEYLYQASSPDEAALVSGAQMLGWQFAARTPDTVTINYRRTEETYNLLNVIDFTSDRKRMSVIVKDKKGVIKVLCKGADSVIFERLNSNQKIVKTVEAQLEAFAHIGLRTLCLAERVISDEEWASWNAKYHDACIAITDREKKIATVAEIIERNLTLVGATAIEDKLQEGVPECIASLAKADIKIWVLTGDKQETAINIGYSCRLLTESMPLMIINAQSQDETRTQIDHAVAEFGPQLKKSNNVGFIIDGHTLKYALKPQLVMDFLKIAISCRAVICCRVSPIQKAELVALVKKYVGAITLAIGDGANDVGMIQAADVGIGINGMEGTQAVCSADYSIAQFRFLKKLLLVHGTWNYYRICKLVLYSFYKNIVVYVMELWFQIYTGFSGQILFERWSIGLYNVVFTFLPPLALGLLDRFTDKVIPMKYPPIYKISQDSTLFNVKVFWMWMLNSIFHSVVLYFLSLLLFYDGNEIPNRYSSGYLYLGNSVFTYTVVTVCLKAGLESYTWTWMHFFAIFGSILSWFLYLGVYSRLWPLIRLGASESMAGQGVMLMSNPVFWFGLLIVPTITLMRDVIWKIIRRTFFVSIKEKVEIFHKERLKHISAEGCEHDAHRDSMNTIGNSSGPGDKSQPTQHPGDPQSMGKVFRRVFAPAAVYNFHPSQQSIFCATRSQHGFAFSQDESNVMRQSQMIRLMDTQETKPSGL